MYSPLTLLKLKEYILEEALPLIIFLHLLFLFLVVIFPFLIISLLILIIIIIIIIILMLLLLLLPLLKPLFFLLPFLLLLFFFLLLLLILPLLLLIFLVSYLADPNFLTDRDCRMFPSCPTRPPNSSVVVRPLRSLRGYMFTFLRFLCSFAISRGRVSLSAVVTELSHVIIRYVYYFCSLFFFSSLWTCY